MRVVIFMLCLLLAQNGPAPLKLIQTISLTGVEGRFDHLTADIKGQRLFVAALGNDTMEVIDLAQGKRLRSITGLSEPQGIVFAPDLNRVFVANGGDGSVRAYDATSLAMSASAKPGADADNIRYDAATGTIIVGNGGGALGTFDGKTMKSIGSVKLAGHPESFQLEKSSPRVYVNVPDAGHITVVDRQKQTIVATWPMGRLRANFPMTLDETNHRLFVGTRSPARLVVIDTVSGKQIAALNCSGDTDDIFYDPQSRRIFVIAGEGFIDVFGQEDSDHYVVLTKLSTAVGARTGLYVPEWQRLFVAVPHRGNQAAAVRIYQVLN